jgi:hypothetical protein
MKPADIFWHIYGRDQIKPPLHGDLVYVLEVPGVPGSPVVRHVFDPTGRQFSASLRQNMRAALARRNHGIVYQGVSKAAAYGLLMVDPRIGKDDPHFLRYNQEVVSNSRIFFLAKPESGMEAMLEALERLLGGLPVSPGDFHLQI